MLLIAFTTVWLFQTKLIRPDYPEIKNYTCQCEHRYIVSMCGWYINSYTAMYVCVEKIDGTYIASCIYYINAALWKSSCKM